MPMMTVREALESAVQAHREGRLADAQNVYRQILARFPEHADALNLLGTLETQMGRAEAAIDLISRAIKAEPGRANYYNSLGNALQLQRKADEAIAAYEKAIALQSDFAEAHNNIGSVYKGQGKLAAAAEAFERAIAIQPQFAQAQSNLGGTRMEQGRVTEAMEGYRAAIAIRPDLAAVHSNLLYAMHSSPDYDPDKVFEAHRAFGTALEAAIPAITGHRNDRPTNRRIKIGYVSPDFRRHSVGFFLEPILKHHDRSKFEIHCYADLYESDAATARMKTASEHWRETTGMPHEQVVQMIVSDGIDILVDLAGHTGYNRMPVFARKPAPVQCTYLGYPDSTGLTRVDYRLTDGFADPVGETEKWHTEKLVRVEPCAWSYLPGEDGSTVEARDAAGPIAFGCFNILSKMTPRVLEVWSRILQEVPGSTLMLKNKSLADEPTRRETRARFAKCGIGQERLSLRGSVPTFEGHLKLYGELDIALDPWPYHGTTTTCEALWMGLPVVSLAGRAHVSRVGVSILTNVGLAQLVAHSDEDYVRIAVALANDRAKLTGLRTGMRQRMLYSPLCDAGYLMRSLEEAYAAAWDRWRTSP